MNSKTIRKRVISLIISLCVLAGIVPLAQIPVNAYNFGNYGAVGTSGYKVFNFNSSWGGDAYSFTPTITGFYQFYSTGSSGDPYFFLTNSSNFSTVRNSIINIGQQNDTARAYSLGYDDDSNGGRNFYLKYWCTANTTYYCVITKFSSSSTAGGDFYVRGPYYNYATLDRQGGTGGTAGYYNDIGYGNSHNGFVAWSTTTSSSSLSVISRPTRTGYTFQGYYTSTGGGGTQHINSAGNFIGHTYNSTLYAYWTANSNTVTNNVSNTTLSSTGNITTGTTLNRTLTASTGYTLPSSISVTIGGASFTGFTYNSSTGAISIPGANVNGNIVISGAATLNTYTVSYNANGGSGVPSNQTKNHGTNLILSSTIPTRAGHAFAGWNTMSNGSGTHYNPGGTYSANAAVTLYAQWRENITVGGNVKIEYSYIENGNTIDVNTQRAASATVVLMRRVAGTTEYSQVQTTTVNFNTGTTERGANGFIFDEKPYNFTNLPPVNTNGTAYEYTVRVDLLNYNATLAGNNIVLAYDPHGFNVSFEITPNLEVTSAVMPQNLHVKVLYWHNSWHTGTGYPQTGIITQHSDFHITAVRDTDGKYKGTYPVWQLDENNTPYGYNITVIGYTLPNGEYVSAEGGGFNFIYNRAEDGTTGWVKYNEGSNQADGIITAVFAPKNYTVSYSPNGGETPVGVPTAYTYGNSVTIPNPLARNGYTFGGWYNNAGFSGSSITAISATDKGNITLYAQWNASTYTVTLDNDGVTEDITATFGEHLPKVTPPKLPDKIFAGYFDEYGTKYYNHDGTSARIFNITDDITLYARWMNGVRLLDAPGSCEIDVQARIVDLSAATYKIDIEWGDMKFEYNLNSNGVWNPDTHQYNGTVSAGWDGMDGYNNQIIVTNHSNSDVIVSLGVSASNNLLAPDVDMEVFTANNGGGTKAQNLPLARVPYNGAAQDEAYSVDTYFWIDGEPKASDITLLKNNHYTRVGTVTVTVKAYGIGFTPY